MKTPKFLQWAGAASIAVGIHAAAFYAMFNATPASGARDIGLGGIEVSLGPAGAPASVPSVAAPETPQSEVEPEDVPEEQPEETIEKLIEEVPEITDIVEQVALPEPIEESAIKEPLPETVPEPVEELPPLEPAETVPVETPTVPVVQPQRKPHPPSPIKEVVEEVKPVEMAKVVEAAPPPQSVAASPAVDGKAGTTEGDQTGGEAASSGGGTPGVSPDYTTLLQAWLEKHKTYPARARLRRQEGIVHLSFTIDRQGQILAHAIERSSGYRLLDQEAVDMLTRAAPLPPMPYDMRQPQLALVVPVQFYLTSRR